MQAGIDAATHDVIVPLDADLQNDPADIPRLLDKLSQGWDVVSGWRKQRMDAAVHGTLESPGQPNDQQSHRGGSPRLRLFLEGVSSLGGQRRSPVRGDADSFPSTPPCKGPRLRSCSYSTIRDPRAKATTVLIGSSR